jgi:hypothetical protein
MTANEHVRHLSQKAHKLKWILRNLKKSGANNQYMTTAYKSYVRSGLEYSSEIYDSLLSNQQVAQIEKLQERALRIIYGWTTDYEKILEMSGLQSLQTRRKQAVERFAKSIEANTRFADKWLKTNENRSSARHSNKYIQPMTKSKPFEKDPINCCIKILNNLNAF